jgi:hypothetical protein
MTPARSTFLKQFHKHYDVVEAASASSTRLVKYGRMLKRGRLREAIRAVIDVRNNYIAHFDLNPKPRGRRRAIIRDLDVVISSASIVFGEAKFYIGGRRVDADDLKRLLRREADGFVTTLQNGIINNDCRSG